MSMDPTKWVPFERLSQRTKERIQQYYPYLKLDHSVFQEKDSGVYMKAINNVKIEKLLDPDRPGATPPPPPPAPAKPVTASGRTRRSSA